MIKENTICDKCGEEHECSTEDFVCVDDDQEEIRLVKKKKTINTYKYMAEVKCSLCHNCSHKRRVRFISFSLLFLAGSLPFFIWWNYIELGFILIVGAVTVALISGKGHEMEYTARHKYRIIQAGNDELVLHPKIITKTAWEKIIKNSAANNSRIIY
jgi:hypothetical protein